VPYFNKHHIKYCNTPGSVAEPTALHTVSRSISRLSHSRLTVSIAQVILVLTTLRRTTAAERSVRRGEWTAGGDSIANKTMGVTQVGRTLGILGMGSIGRIVGRYLSNMGMRVIYHNRRRLSEEAADGAEYVADFDEVRPIQSRNAPLPLR
jgi:lactate dehydrogenase-like 2-hydroxyacid dehydrogenase